MTVEACRIERESDGRRFVVVCDPCDWRSRTSTRSRAVAESIWLAHLAGEGHRDATRRETG